MGKKPTVFRLGEVHFTVRSDSNSQMKVLRSSLETGAINSKEHQLECNILWTEGFQTNENNKKQQITSELLQNQ
jgi:hypothetical protein